MSPAILYLVTTTSSAMVGSSSELSPFSAMFQLALSRLTVRYEGVSYGTRYLVLIQSFGSSVATSAEQYSQSSHSPHHVLDDEVVRMRIEDV